MHIYVAKSSRFESTGFASVMTDDVGCVPSVKYRRKRFSSFPVIEFFVN